MTHYTLILLVLFLFVVLPIMKRVLFPKGDVGERRVARILRRLPQREYVVLNDIILPTNKGTSQIDHIVVSVYGLFVIETKYYKGKIYGGENSEYWTQHLYGESHQFYNPILQNAGHVKALRNVLSEFGYLPILSMVAFSGQADLRMKITNACIVYWKQIIRVIYQFEERRLTEDQVEEVVSTIKNVRLNNKEHSVRREHKKNARKARNSDRKRYSAGICPECGSRLVLREGKYGRFYGCSNYPKCTYTRKG